MELVEGFKIIELETFINLGGGCPTQFEFSDVEGDEFYFRFRWGHATLMNMDTEEYLISAPIDGFGGWDGFCTPEDMVKWAEKHKVLIIGLDTI